MPGHHVLKASIGQRSVRQDVLRVHWRHGRRDGNGESQLTVGQLKAVPIVIQIAALIRNKGVVIGDGRRGLRIAVAVAACRYTQRGSFFVSSNMITRFVSYQGEKTVAAVCVLETSVGSGCASSVGGLSLISALTVEKVSAAAQNRIATMKSKMPIAAGFGRCEVSTKQDDIGFSFRVLSVRLTAFLGCKTRELC